MKHYLVGMVCGLMGGIFFLTGPALAFGGPEGCAKECSACHTLTKEEAGKMLKTEVKTIKESSVRGLWELEGTQKGKPFRVYLDFGKKNLIVGRVIPVSQIGKPPPLRKLDRSQLPMKNAIPMGNPKAKHRIVVFDDPDCPYCKKFHEEMKKIVKERKDVAFDILLFPITSIHPKAYKKSLTIQCKRSVKLLEKAYAGEKLPEPDCKTNAVDENIGVAGRLGIRGTPAIILPDGRLIPGYIKASELLKRLDKGPPEAEKKGK